MWLVIRNCDLYDFMMWRFIKVVFSCKVNLWSTLIMNCIGICDWHFFMTICRNGIHACLFVEWISYCSNIVLGSHGQVSRSILSSSIKYEYTSSWTIYTPNDIYNDMLHMYKVLLNYVKAWRSRKKILKMIKADLKNSFMNILSFFFMLQQTNLAMITGLEFDGHNKFKYYSLALGASIRGWEYCKLVIVVEIVFEWKLWWYFSWHVYKMLKTIYSYLHLKLEIMKMINLGNGFSKTWRRRMCIVMDCVLYLIAIIISRMQLKICFPGNCYGICLYHFLQNLKSYYGKLGYKITRAFNSTVAHTHW